MVRNQPAMQEMQVQSLDWEDPLEEKMQPTAVVLPGKCHEQRSLQGYSPRGQKRDTIEQPNHQQIKLGSTANHLDSSLTFQGRRKGTPRIVQRQRETAGKFTLAGLEVTVTPPSLLKRQALSSRDLGGPDESFFFFLN